MKVKMVFGTIMSALLAYGVLRIFGMYQGTMTPFEIAAGILLTTVYLMVFRAGAVGKEEAVVLPREQVMNWEEEERAFVEKAAVTAAAA